jgi:hypothetical protein
VYTSRFVLMMLPIIHSEDLHPHVTARSTASDASGIVKLRRQLAE